MSADGWDNNSDDDGFVEGSFSESSTFIAGKIGSDGKARSVKSVDKGDVGFVDMFRKAHHPCAASFHVLFKVAAWLTYFFCTWFTNNFVLVFVLCVILFAVDFWVVKNVSGRLLVGLRWWSDLDENGKNQWRFESMANPEAVGKLDSRIFWYSMYVNTIVWIVFSILALIRFKFDWLLVCVVALVLSTSNLVGYTKCSKDAKTNMQQRMRSVVTQGAIKMLTGGFSSIFGGSSSSSSSSQVAQV